MKKIIILITLFINSIAYGQNHKYSCFMDNMDAPAISQASSPSRATTLICDTANNFRQFIRVNVHWVLKDDGTGNFRANDDGNGNIFITGYTKAEEMIDGANSDLLDNQHMWLPSGNTTPEMPVGIGFVLNGVFFDKSTVAGSVVNTNFNVHSTFGKDIANTLNIYMIEADPTIDRDASKPGIQTYNGGGIANQLSFTNPPGPAVKLYGTWYNYNYYNNGWNGFQIRLLQHEIGHTLSLIHTYDGNDGCNDTPLNNNCWDYQPTGGANCDTWAEISNNVMDYNQWQPAYTPCQIGRITSTITSATGVNYIYNCSDCTPANANFTIATQYCGNSPIPMDCRGSYQENNYFLEIYKTTSLTSTNVITGTYFSSWYSSTAPLINNLRTIYTPGFGNGVYRVKLAVQNFRPNSQACNIWDEEVKYFTSYLNSNCTPGSGKTGDLIEGQDNLEESPLLSVYPNPSNGSISIYANNINQECRILITNINGQTVIDQMYSFTGLPLTLNLEDSGLYNVQILTNTQVSNKKIIVIK